MTIQNDVQIRVGQWYEIRLHYQHHIGNATKNIRKTQPMQICFQEYTHWKGKLASEPL
uniref:Uncharacterized protein n=1 Tax=Solanum tuberosum TaxID=4113 RepID=M1CZ11_SOLTU